MIGPYIENNIYNVDSYEAIKFIPNKTIDLVYIDIPYLYNNGGGSCSELGQRLARKKLQLMGANEKYIKSFSSNKEALRIARNKQAQSLQLTNIENGINYIIFDELCRIMKKINIYIWCSKLQINDIMNYFLKKDCNFELLVWCKTNPTPSTNNTYLPDLEYCLFFREKGVKLNDGYELKSKYFIDSINKKDKDLYDHPTIKPLELVKRHIEHSTQKNDIVLDCFLGSGTTAVACKETGRQYLGFEIDPTYYEIACNRLKGYSQRDIQKKKNGQLDLFDF